MDPANMIVLQAALHALREKHPARDRIRTLTDYAAANLPEKYSDLPLDELATVVALKAVCPCTAGDLVAGEFTQTCRAARTAPT